MPLSIPADINTQHFTASVTNFELAAMDRQLAAYQNDATVQQDIESSNQTLKYVNP